VDYAHKLARRYGWRTDKTLPQGFSPGGVAKDVIIKVIEGDRTWDEAKEPNFLNALKGMVRSDIGHLFDDYEASRIEPIERTLPDGSVRGKDRELALEQEPQRQQCDGPFHGHASLHWLLAKPSKLLRSTTDSYA